MKRIAPLLLLFAAASCSSDATRDTDTVGEGKKVWPDVPIAKGLKYELGEGEKTPDASIRSYRMELRGGLKVEEVVTFYSSILKDVHHWDLVHQESDEKSAQLVFEKEKEKLTLDAKRVSIRETEVHIKIGPK